MMTTVQGTDEPTERSKEPKPVKRFRAVWFLAILRGFVLLVLGLLLMIQPIATDFGTLRWVVGLFVAGDAVLAAWQGLAHRKQPAWQAWLAQAVVDAVFALVVMFWPDLSQQSMYYLFASWAIALGVTVVVTAGSLARARDLEWSWQLMAGIVGFLFGTLLLLRSSDLDDDLATTTLVFAFYAFAIGAVYVVTGFATRGLARELRALRERAGDDEDEVARGRTGSVLGGVVLPQRPAPAPEPSTEPAAEPALEPAAPAPVVAPEASEPETSEPETSEPERVLPGLGEERVPDERHDVEDRVRDDERHDTPTSPA
ncbi:HdeD family acid-resistance protein [Luteimicrobium subarcticum]|uniref:Uncharacterized membrane protein HdeD (DUF308 family) n=1 Tax=Luteimicrobium subarcticum TaxID=620910 RepID=A0A2M8WS38_9MICO|nr:DUF308 domain-containing protein [Luteimicrobium subarcticum]PJI93646.1 uncharacterized membrane protein HdeD (DUF308 family) [Luteimicrobium subarcticum]